jgi:hypothetical protein
LKYVFFPFPPLITSGNIEAVRVRERRYAEFAWKLVKLHLIMPIWATGLAVFLWYRLLFLEKIYAGPELRETLIAGWIPILGLLYALFGTMIFGFAFNKYVMIRCAISAFDFHEFMKWRKETTSPVFHSVMTFLAVGIIAGFASMPYSNCYVGACLVGGSTYMFALFFWVIREVDNPFAGIWFIRFVPPEWERVDSARYREIRMAEKRETWAMYLREEEKKEPIFEAA